MTFLFLKIVLSLIANNADIEEMQPYAAFHQEQGLHCLPNYLFTGIENEKG